MRSLTFKLALAFLLVSLTGVVLVAASISGLTRLEFDQFVLDRYQVEVIQRAADFYLTTGSWEGAEAALHHSAGMIGSGERGQSRQGLIVFDADKQLVVDDRPTHLIAGGNGEADPDRATPIEANGQVIGYVQFLGELPRGANSQSPEIAFLRNVSRATIWSALGAAALALLLGIALARTISRPVRELTLATKAVAAGELGAQVPVRTDDELGELAHSFNRMSTDLAQSNHVRKQMTADIAHDLRTPLSVILGYAEALQDGKLPGTPETFGAIHLQAQHLSRLIDDLRTLSLADAGQLSLQRRIVSPRTLLEHTALAYLPHAEARRIDLTIDDNDAPAVSVDPDRLVQVLGNLVSNALRHTPDGGRIDLSTGQAAGQVQLWVQDSGPGIPDEDLPHIFDRFYRGDKSRTTNGASGLGLAIARSMVEAHGGRVTAENMPAGGARFTVWLPIAPAEPVAAAQH